MQTLSTLPKPIIKYQQLPGEELFRRTVEAKRVLGDRVMILGHNYQRDEVIEHADFRGDSLLLSKLAAERSERPYIVFCGVHFMAETAAILSPRKRVLLPDLKAGCSLAATITAEDVRRWKAAFPGYIAVGYVNTTAEVKAELDYCCTSGNVLDVIDAIPSDTGILFLPDFFLGSHVRRMRPDRRIEVWMGECHVHKGIRPEVLNEARATYPDAEVLVHPECGCAGQRCLAASVAITVGDARQGLTERMVEGYRAEEQHQPPEEAFEAIVVPRISGRKELRMTSGISSAIAGRTAGKCRTFAPKYASSAASANDNCGTRRG